MGKLGIGRKIIRFALVISVAIPLGIFIANTDFKSVQKELMQVGANFGFILVTTGFAYLLGTWSWRICLGKEALKISMYRLFVIRLIGETVGLFNPSSIVGGDMVKAQLLKNHHIDSGTASQSVLSSRTTAILSQVFLFMVAICWLMLSGHRQQTLAITGPFIYLVVLILLLLHVLLLQWLGSPAKMPYQHSTALNWYTKIKNSVGKHLVQLKNFYQYDKKRFWQSYLVAALHWVAGSLELYFILYFLGFKAHLIQGLALDMSIIGIKSCAAFIPGQLGVEEMANKITLAMIGISGGNIWITVSILRRTRQLIWIFMGVVFLCFFKNEVRNSTAEA